jgi:hypothetical protein
MPTKAWITSWMSAKSLSHWRPISWKSYGLHESVLMVVMIAIHWAAKATWWHRDPPSNNSSGCTSSTTTPISTFCHSRRESAATTASSSRHMVPASETSIFMCKKGIKISGVVWHRGPPLTIVNKNLETKP